MSTIPISVSEEQFDQHIRLFLSTAKRSYECKIALVKVFNYILYHLHTGCQWSQLPIATSVKESKKKRLAGKWSIITFRNGVRMAVYDGFGSRRLRPFVPISIWRI